MTQKSQTTKPKYQQVGLHQTKKLRENPVHCWREYKLVQHYGKQYRVSQKLKNRTTV